MATVEKYLETQKKHEDVWNEADKKLKEVVEGNRSGFGLVNDETKKSEAYITAKKRYDFAFKMMRDFNKTIPKKIAKEMSLIKRKEKYGVAF